MLSGLFKRRAGAPPPPSVENLVPQAWPPGHFYSPLASQEDVVSGLRTPSELRGIDLHDEDQPAFLTEIEALLPRLRFPDVRTPGRRYFYDNGSFAALDAVCLATMLARFRPRRVIEVGSGHSSAALLDLRDDGIFAPQDLVFIDPDFSRLDPLLGPADRAGVTLLQQRVQDVPLTRFDSLESGDLLFIDSSHVSKVGSDVNHLVFEILPRLKPGVVAHVHDVFSNFEYPRAWFDEGRHWNEQYLLRAFLMHNHAFRVLLLSSRLYDRHTEFFRTHLPVALRHGGGQLWFRANGR
jgi:hypothetical protein